MDAYIRIAYSVRHTIHAQRYHTAAKIFTAGECRFLHHFDTVRIYDGADITRQSKRADAARPQRTTIAILRYAPFVHHARILARQPAHRSTDYIGCYRFVVAITMMSCINIVWKISAHMCGIGGLCGAFFAVSWLLYANNLPLMIGLILLSGILAWARLECRAHTAAQLAVGFIVGFSGGFLPLLIRMTL